MFLLQNYIFSLLTGYCDPPAGVTLQEEQHYNPYFPGQAISMAKALYNEIIEYEDGTIGVLHYKFPVSKCLCRATGMLLIICIIPEF